MRTALITGGVLAAALTLGGTAPAFADGAGTTEPAPPAALRPRSTLGRRPIATRSDAG